MPYHRPFNFTCPIHSLLTHVQRLYFLVLVHCGIFKISYKTVVTLSYFLCLRTKCSFQYPTAKLQTTYGRLFGSETKFHTDIKNRAYRLVYFIISYFWNYKRKIFQISVLCKHSSGFLISCSYEVSNSSQNITFRHYLHCSRSVYIPVPNIYATSQFYFNNMLTFHCFTVHFNSLNFIHQLMHFYIQ